MQLRFVQGHPEVLVTSDLQGLGIKLPAPLQKPAGLSWPLRVELALDPATLAAGRTPRDRLSVDLGPVLQARYERELAATGARVLRGGVGIGEAAPMPATGVSAHIQQQSLDIDAWLEVAKALQPGEPASAPAGSSSAAATAPSGHEPDSISLRAQEMTVEGRRLTNMKLQATRQSAGWRANVDADQLSGYVEFRASQPLVPGRVYARLARLAVPESGPGQVGVGELLDQPTASVPALDIVVEDFEVHGRKLGRLEIEAVNHDAGDSREWKLSKFNVQLPEARLAASGAWEVAKGGASRPRAVMDFRLDLSNSGALLDRLGQRNVVRGGKGRIEGQVSWQGSPFEPDFPSLGGQFNVDVSQGQFLKADPGIAKLAGILSLQSLPRRLLLDFRDVYQEGFAFDAFSGDVKIAEGVAQTNNLRLRGVSAAVLMEGRADIDEETQDLRVVVVPEINAGTASLAYAAINPAIGLGTFLAQLFLRKPMMQAGTREFHVTGSWTDPKVEVVRRKLTDPVPEPLSAPSEGVPLAMP